jgi:hypothetical protein
VVEVGSFSYDCGHNNGGGDVATTKVRFYEGSRERSKGGSRDLVPVTVTRKAPGNVLDVVVLVAVVVKVIQYRIYTIDYMTRCNKAKQTLKFDLEWTYPLQCPPGRIRRI